MPQISVIVPVYKVEPYLRRCLDSILGQTFADFELILVDDGSPDNCPAICDEYAWKDTRVHVIHQENGGLSAARNAGIDWAFANSDSQWLNFVDSDDWVHPEYLERLLDAAIKYNVKISICSHQVTGGENPIVLDEDLVPQLWKSEDFYVQQNGDATVACSKLYNKDCFQTIRYPVGKLHEDVFVTYLILFGSPYIAVIKAPLYAYYQSPQSITRSKWTPKRMDVLEGRNQQIDFFRQQGFQNALQKTSFLLLWNIASHIKMIETEEASKYLSYVPKLRQLLRREIRKNKQLLRLSFKKNYDLYEVAYPTLMQCYWLFQVVLKKLHLRK